DLQVIEDNYQSDVRLSYDDAEDGYGKVILAIGGNTLSRGLTLEGLVASLFIRPSNTYDTLLQMGRWFGYRP
ncbi:Z1 domain-containing protein, partial [Klebsiella pneumoniae]